ncbi:hypothetical protein BDZ91DRAFT_794216 [Kalaharituber pfeilii]|nr:hypothetical protein BDZ91DRAFT_794216 [Kalaharituber pfeilii]
MVDGVFKKPHGNAAAGSNIRSRKRRSLPFYVYKDPADNELEISLPILHSQSVAFTNIKLTPATRPSPSTSLGGVTSQTYKRKQASRASAHPTRGISKSRPMSPRGCSSSASNRQAKGRFSKPNFSTLATASRAQTGYTRRPLADLSLYEVNLRALDPRGRSYREGYQVCPSPRIVGGERDLVHDENDIFVSQTSENRDDIRRRM